jgi:hypothetical protein
MGQTRNHWNRIRKVLRGRAGVGVVLAGGLLLSPGLTPRAQACGGFWCSLQNPVEQSAEQIIFIDHPDETVTAVIQIQYQGPAEKFAWVVPIPGDPEIAVSSNTAFQRLREATDPQYQLEVEVEGMCNQQHIFERGDFNNVGSAAAPGAGMAMTDKAVTVVSMGSVGPYDYTTIAVDPQLPDAADVAIEWFRDNGYDLSGVDAEVLGPYLDEGLNLLAFKLTKTAAETSGAIRPVILKYESELPMIPIRPTAVAAQNDMGIRVWVSAASQAVPVNYKSLVLNEALINWFNYQTNYDEVVTAAANEAGGQGFVTELAGNAAEYEQLIWSDDDQTTWEMLRNQSYPDGIDAMWAANDHYRDWEGWRDVIMASTTLPQGTTFDEFARDPNSFKGRATVDTQKFFSELHAKVIEPVAKTQELLVSRPYLTRMYSTMSADEMTMDPAFGYNSDLAAVSNIHKAKQYIECNPNVSQYEAPWRIELPQGGVIRGTGSYEWPIEVDGSLPANLKVVQLSSTGSGQVVADNSSVIGEALFKVSKMVGTGEMKPPKPMSGVPIGGEQTVRVPSAPGANGNGGDSSAESSSNCAVNAPGHAAAGSWLALVSGGLAALWLARRRRARS